MLFAVANDPLLVQKKCVFRVDVSAAVSDAGCPVCRGQALAAAHWMLFRQTDDDDVDDDVDDGDDGVRASCSSAYRRSLVDKGVVDFQCFDRR